MASETDLRRALSMRPSPFHPDLNPSSSSLSPHSHRSHTPIPASSEDARTTAYELQSPSVDSGSDPVARHHPLATATEADADADVRRDADIERQRHVSSSDPYQLRSKLKSPNEIETIRANTSRKRDEGPASTILAPLHKTQSANRSRKLRQFYESQNENIERLLKPVDDHRREAKQEQGENQLRYKIAVTGSFVANVILAVLQVFAAVRSGSLALFTTMADALFDPLSNITLILCNRAVRRVDSRKFPSGKARIETAGNIAFCFLMAAVSLLIVCPSPFLLAFGNAQVGILT
jgi:hypothetical protein